MPAVDPVDPTTLGAVVAQLTRSGQAAQEASHEILSHYADAGEVPTQRAVDTLIDHAADALQVLTDSLADVAGQLDAAGRRPTAAGSPGAVSRTRTSRRGHPA